MSEQVQPPKKAPQERRTWKKRLSGVDPLDFSPPLLRIQAQPPAPFARTLLHVLLVLLAFLIIWSALGRLDVVATAEGKLLPQSYLKIVQPSEQGIIRDILVKEGQPVKAGQLLMRMDATLSSADGKELGTDRQDRQIALRRIDAELTDKPLRFLPYEVASHQAKGSDLAKAEYQQACDEALAQYRANRAAYLTALAEAQSMHDKAQSDLASAQEVRTKLLQTLPHFRAQDEAYSELAKEGYVSELSATDKARERIEKEQDLKSQEHIIDSAHATLTQSLRKLAQVTADYHQKLQAERADNSEKLDKVEQELAKQQYRHALLELRAPQAGIVKDLATHTSGTVISPGSILMTLVPTDKVLRAEVWVSNQDVGFIHPGEPVKLKLATYQFQKYGMIDGAVANLGADASDNNQAGQQAPSGGKSASTPPFAYRALVDLKEQYLMADGVRHNLAPGMQVTAEIKLGSRSILEYLLSPVMGAFQEAAREP